LLGLAYSDQVLLVGAGSATDVEAVYLFPYTAYAAEWMLLVTTASGRRHTAKLLWYAIHQFKSKNIPILNLGGGVKEDDSVAQAKQRYGAKRIPTKALKQIYDAEVYSMLCQQAGVEHMSDGGYFPAYRRP
jgi:hypothetical protein